MIIQSESVPKTAKLLACKKWWKVCFPYGDQEKYYRQLYSRAAAQRLANSSQDGVRNKKKIIFPTKLHRTVLSENEFHASDYSKTFHEIQIKSGRILADSFLSRIIEEVNENDSDSGIDAWKAESNKVGIQEL